MMELDYQRLIELLILATLFVVTVIISCISSVGFYTACSFDGDEDYDKFEYKKQWPKPTADQVMILWWVRYYGGRVIPYFWTKPIYSCLPCMGSLHSLIPVYVFTGNIWLWPLVAFSTVGVNKLITIWWSK